MTSEDVSIILDTLDDEEEISPYLDSISDRREGVSVIVVTHNSEKDISLCLDSVGDQRQVIVVDNASTDGTVEIVESRFPKATLIRNRTNRGFGAANNQGLEAAECELVLLLNPDAIAHEGAIQTLAYTFQEHPYVVACGGRLENPDETLQESACTRLTLWAVFCEQTLLEKLFPNSELLSPYWVSRRLIRSGDRAFHSVEQVMGACLMFRNDRIRFDERFFLYCEDTDFCRRLKQSGEILYVPSARFTHRLGSSSAATRYRAIRYYNRGKELYFLIHSGPAAAVVCFMLNRFGAMLRLVGWTLISALSLFTRRSWRSRISTFAQVLWGPFDPYPKVSES